MTTFIPIIAARDGPARASSKHSPCPLDGGPGYIRPLPPIQLRSKCPSKMRKPRASISLGTLPRGPPVTDAASSVTKTSAHDLPLVFHAHGEPKSGRCSAKYPVLLLSLLGLGAVPTFVNRTNHCAGKPRNDFGAAPVFAESHPETIFKHSTRVQIPGEARWICTANHS